MESVSRKLYNEAKEAGQISEKTYLKFKGTGKHTLKFIKDEMFDGTNYRTKQPERKMRYTFEENGATKLYETAVFKKDENGNETKDLSSFLKQINPYNYGDTIIAEYTPIQGTPRGFVRVSEQTFNPEAEATINEPDDIPTIDEADYPAIDSNSDDSNSNPF